MDIDFIKDYGEIIVGVISFIVGTFLTILIYKLTAKNKKLEYEILSNYKTIFVKDKGKIKDKIEILYKGKKVENLYLLTLRFKNNGNVSITKNDIKKPIRVYLKQAATTIFSHQIINCIPKNIGIESNIFTEMKDKTENSYTGIELTSCLLNPKDEFELVIMLQSSKEPIFSVEARIDGIKKIKQIKNQIVSVSFTEKEFGQSAFFFTLIIALVVFIRSLTLNFENWRYDLLGIAGFILFLMMAFSFVGVIKPSLRILSKIKHILRI